MTRQPPDQHRFQAVACPGEHREDDPVRQVLQRSLQGGAIDKWIAAKSLDRNSVAVRLTWLPSLDAGQDCLPPRGGVGAVIRVVVGIIGMTVMFKVREARDLERQDERNGRDISDQLARLELELWSIVCGDF
jgi:hypothetical protein